MGMEPRILQVRSSMVRNSSSLGVGDVLRGSILQVGAEDRHEAAGPLVVEAIIQTETLLHGRRASAT